MPQAMPVGGRKEDAKAEMTFSKYTRLMSCFTLGILAMMGLSNLACRPRPAAKVTLGPPHGRRLRLQQSTWLPALNMSGARQLQAESICGECARCNNEPYRDSDGKEWQSRCEIMEDDPACAQNFREDHVALTAGLLRACFPNVDMNAKYEMMGNQAKMQFHWDDTADECPQDLVDFLGEVGTKATDATLYLSAEIHPKQDYQEYQNGRIEIGIESESSLWMGFDYQCLDDICEYPGNGRLHARISYPKANGNPLMWRFNDALDCAGTFQDDKGSPLDQFGCDMTKIYEHKIRLGCIDGDALGCDELKCHETAWNADGGACTDMVGLNNWVVENQISTNPAYSACDLVWWQVTTEQFERRSDRCARPVTQEETCEQAAVALGISLTGGSLGECRAYNGMASFAQWGPCTPDHACICHNREGFAAQIDSGSCQEHGYEAVTSISKCQQAAKEIGYERVHGRDGECRIWKDKVSFAAWGPCSHEHECICLPSELGGFTWVSNGPGCEKSVVSLSECDRAVNAFGLTLPFLSREEGPDRACRVHTSTQGADIPSFSAWGACSPSHPCICYK
eukprot:TRINITY_DN20801_c0_g3_i1.p1 TRINITY_DN20801_c0_g3~~TRINITY_DN20801_c0_g3_i1.p1  ORF type:complete len:568 (-),score=42.56 TRINITY_DN20801_c0_g3_i1:86-1789(-)